MTDAWWWFWSSLSLWFFLRYTATYVLALLMFPVMPWRAVALVRWYHGLNKEHHIYWLRISRSLVYYILASWYGVQLFWSATGSIHDMLNLYSPTHEMAFAAAASHFLFLVYEDWVAREQLAVTADLAPSMGTASTADMGYFIFATFAFHHVTTSIAYSIALSTHQVGSMFSCGLMFEAPVFFSTIRECIVHYDAEYGLLRRLVATRVGRFLFWANWVVTFVAVTVFRMGSILLFMWSGWFWQPELQQLSVTSQAAFYTFGSLFSCINCYWLGMMAIGALSDHERIEKIVASGADTKSAPPSSPPASPSSSKPSRASAEVTVIVDPDSGPSDSVSHRKAATMP